MKHREKMDEKIINIWTPDEAEMQAKQHDIVLNQEHKDKIQKSITKLLSDIENQMKLRKECESWDSDFGRDEKSPGFVAINYIIDEMSKKGWTTWVVCCPWLTTLYWVPKNSLTKWQKIKLRFMGYTLNGE